jgi:hypothetical protein
MIIQIVFQSGEVINEGPVKNFLDYLFMILPSLTGILTLIIAYKVFRNYDAKKVFVKYQIELVLKLAESLEKTLLMFQAHISLTDFASDSFHVSSINLILKRRETHKHIFGKRLLVRNSFWEIELFTYINNMLLPKKIRKEMLKFYLSVDYPFVTFKNEELQKMQDIVILTALDEKKLESNYTPSPESLSAHEINNPKFKNTDDFLSAILELKKTIVGWLQDYGIEANVEEI